MKYELINPSDEVWFEASSDEVAACAAALAGDGAYAAKREDDGVDVGGFALFDGGEHLLAKLGMDVLAFVEKHREEVKDALRSFRYVRERSSVTRIVDYAHSIAKAVEEKRI